MNHHSEDKPRRRGQHWLKQISRVPKVGALTSLMLAAGVAEGLGLSILVPVVFTLTKNIGDQELPMPFRLLPEAIVKMGLNPSFEALLTLALLTMLIAFALIHFQDRFTARSRYSFLQKIRDQVSDSIFQTNWERLSRLSTGDVVNQVLIEAERGVDAQYALIQMAATLVQICVYVTFAIFLSWKMSLVAIITIVLSALSGRRLIDRTKLLGEQATKFNDRYSSQLVDYLKVAKLLKASGTEDNVRARLASSNYSSTETLRAIVVSQASMRFELQALVSVAVVMIIYLSVVIMKLEVSILLMFMYIVMRITPKFSMFQSYYHVFSAFSPAMEKVDSQIKESLVAADNLNPIGLPFVGVKYAIELSAVHYRHPDSNSDLLKCINLRIPTNKMVALVGPSGGGKSTILDLLIGLIVPSSGRIEIDSLDLRCFEQRSYRRNVGFVPQESSLFSGSIRENLTMFDMVDEARLWRALKLAQIDDFVRAQPGGLDSVVGEDGVRLSGGQRQRLSIARAMVREPALIVLDEATSSLDSEAEMRFQHAIEQLAGFLTMVVVAHRLSTVRNADWIYVIHEGVVAEQGNFASLSEAGGIFASMLLAQGQAH